MLLAVAASVSVAQTQEGQQAQDDEAIAEALIEARPYASADAFLERLAASVELSDADIEQAGTMLTGFDE